MDQQNKTKIHLLAVEVDEDNTISIDSTIVDSVVLLNALYNPENGKLTVLYVIQEPKEEAVKPLIVFEEPESENEKSEDDNEGDESESEEETGKE